MTLCLPILFYGSYQFFYLFLFQPSLSRHTGKTLGTLYLVSICPGYGGKKPLTKY